jgi:hypothetical protein
MNKVDSKDTKEKVKKSLNTTGVFLEDAVANILSQKPDSVVKREVPFSIPFYEKTGTLDVLYITIKKDNLGLALDPNLILPIECKKSIDKSKLWVFTPDKEDSPLPIVEKISLEEGHYNNSYLIQHEKFQIKHYINCFQFHEKTAHLNRQRELMPYHAMLTPNEYITSTQLEKNSKPIERHLKLYNTSGNWVFIPIVCTNARLFATDYSYEDIDTSTGDLDPSKLNLVEKDWIIYAFPLGYGSRPNPHKEYPGKRLTIIVNSSKILDLEEFIFTNLLQHIKEI